YQAARPRASFRLRQRLRASVRTGCHAYGNAQWLCSRRRGSAGFARSAHRARQSLFRSTGIRMTTQDYIKDGTAIYERSFAIIRAEADLSAFSEAEADIAVRMIHACGLVEASRHFVFSAGFVEAGCAALEAGAPILCDAEM